MKSIPAYLLVGVLLTGLTASLYACNMPTRRNSIRPTAEAVYTQSAATIVAQLTDISQGEFPLESTPSSTNSIVSATRTMTPTTTITPPAATLTQTPSITTVSSATITATLAVMPTGEDPRQLLGEPDWSDDFTNDFSWAPYEDDHVRFQLRESQMLMQAKSAVGRDSWMLASHDPEDYYLEMTSMTQTCEGEDRYGLILRSDARTGYLFGLSCDGQYSFRVWDGENFTPLVDWTSIPAIIAGSGQTNRLGVIAEGDQYRLYANGTLLTTVTDGTFDNGGFGLFVAAENTENFTARVSEVAYWELEL